MTAAFLWRIREIRDERVRAQQRLHDPALDADTAAVDQPHLAKAAGVRRAQILVDHRWHVAWEERVQIEAVLDRQLGGQSCGPASTCCCQC